MTTDIVEGFLNLNLAVTIASGDALDVRDFAVEEGVSELFEIRLTAVSPSPDVDFESSVGGVARFAMQKGAARSWDGVAARIEHVATGENGLCTYEIVIVPRLWLLSQRRNYRVFQDMSELDIVLAVFGEWDIEPRLDLDAASYKKRRYRTQYAESDLQFVSRMLEDAGISYFFEDAGGTTKLVLADAPNRRDARAPIPFVATPDQAAPVAYVTAVRSMRQVKPGKYTQSDVDYRKPANYPLAASAFGGVQTEGRLERYHHNYGSFLWKGGGSGGTPHADDRGAARTDEGEGKTQTQKRLDAQRVDARVVQFDTTDHSFAPGNVVEITRHPRAELAAPLLLVHGHIEGDAKGVATHHCEARYTDVDFRPALSTPKPRTLGVESATVTGPGGEEIHTDEFGRIRLHFHWDREGSADETSSCWVPVSQPWAGAGFGAISLPRVGQEVLVDFLGADPDRPVVVGRVFTLTNPPPYQLPEYKMSSGLRSETYPRPKGPSQAHIGGGPATEGAHRLPVGGGVPNGPIGGLLDSALGAVESIASSAKQILPGAFGGPQAPLQALVNAATSLNSHGPDQGDAQRSANGVVSHDAANAEMLYLQGQKDMKVIAKNNLVGGVGANRAFNVLGNDSQGITGYQSTNVGMDRTVQVTGTQTHLVNQDIQTFGNANHVIQTKSDFVSQTVEGQQTFTSPKQISLTVGPSTIVIRPDCIAIDSPLVLVNPGPSIMQSLASGAPASSAVSQSGGGASGSW